MKMASAPTIVLVNISSLMNPKQKIAKGRNKPPAPMPIAIVVIFPCSGDVLEMPFAPLSTPPVARLPPVVTADPGSTKAEVEVAVSGAAVAMVNNVVGIAVDGCGWTTDVDSDGCDGKYERFDGLVRIDVPLATSEDDSGRKFVVDGVLSSVDGGEDENETGATPRDD